MESIAYKLKIQTLKAQVALCQLICASLAREFEEESLTFVERSALAHRWDDTLKDGYVLQLTLDLLERQEREKNKQLNSTPSPRFAIKRVTHITCDRSKRAYSPSNARPLTAHGR